MNHVDSFSGELKNSSILSESRNGIAPFITEMSQSHHEIFSSLSIVSCGNDIEQILQDYQLQLHMAVHPL